MISSTCECASLVPYLTSERLLFIIKDFYFSIFSVFDFANVFNNMYIYLYFSENRNYIMKMYTE